MYKSSIILRRLDINYGSSRPDLEGQSTTSVAARGRVFRPVAFIIKGLAPKFSSTTPIHLGSDRFFLPGRFRHLILTGRSTFGLLGLHKAAHLLIFGGCLLLQLGCGGT